MSRHQQLCSPLWRTGWQHGRSRRHHYNEQGRELGVNLPGKANARCQMSEKGKETTTWERLRAAAGVMSGEPADAMLEGATPDAETTAAMRTLLGAEQRLLDVCGVVSGADLDFIAKNGSGPISAIARAELGRREALSQLEARLGAAVLSAALEAERKRRRG